MAGVLDVARRKRWAPGPQAKIDWTHPLSVGLVVYLTPYGRDLVTGAAVTDVSSTVTPTPSPYGPASTLASATSARYRFPVGLHSASANMTVDMVTSPPASGDIRVGLWGGLGTDQRVVLILDSTGAVTGGIRTAAAVYPLATASAGTVTRWAHIACIGGGGVASLAFVNGAQVATSGATTGTGDTTVSTVGFGLGSSEAFTFGGPWAAARMWNRPLSQSELTALAADPFCFVRTRG